MDRRSPIRRGLRPVTLQSFAPFTHKLDLRRQNATDLYNPLRAQMAAIYRLQPCGALESRVFSIVFSRGSLMEDTAGQ
jgi:hypothetical protein